MSIYYRVTRGNRRGQEATGSGERGAVKAYGAMLGIGLVLVGGGGGGWGGVGR